METSIGIAANHRSETALALSKVLADEFVLGTKTRNAHWNVEGIDFHAKHLFFESQYNQLDELIDEIAERIRALGHYAPASLKDYLSLTHFSEDSSPGSDSLHYIKLLLADHESMIMELRKLVNKLADEFHDLGTSDFITGIMEKHEKMAWMLRAHVGQNG